MADYYGTGQPVASSSRLTTDDVRVEGAYSDEASRSYNYNDNTMATSRTVARARARSIGTDKRTGMPPRTTSSYAALPFSSDRAFISEADEDEENQYLTEAHDEYGEISASAVRGDYRSAAATPDYVLQGKGRGSAASKPATWSIYDELAHGPSRAAAIRGKQSRVGDAEASPREYASANSSRPRLTNQIRSLFTSFTSGQQGEPGNGVSSDAKARTSSDYERVGGSSSSSRFQGLTASAQSLVNDANLQTSSSGNWSKRLQLPKVLAMPAARQASPSGLAGFNDDSPPLTPSSSEHAEEVLLTPRGNTGERWASQQANGTWPYSSVDRTSSWTPFSSTTTASSGRLSPILSLFSTSTADSISPPSRPSSITSVQRKASAMRDEGILPSHYFSPPASPEPFLERKRVPSSQQALAASWTEASTTLSSALTSRFASLSKKTKMPPLGAHVPAILFFLTAFIASTTCVVLALSTLPLRLPSHITELTLTEIRDMSVSLRDYSLSSHKAFAHTLAVLGFFFTWKQSFTVPGSLIMNVVFGAMYGTLFGTIYTSTLTAVGGVFCYLLVAPLAPLVSAMPGLKIGLDKIRRALQGGMDDQPAKPMRSQSAPMPGMRSGSVSGGPMRRQSKRQKGSAKQGADNNIWSYLLILRLLPIVPYGLMNIACSVLRVPLLPYAVTLAIGSIPWNACTVQIGDLLVEVASAFDEVPAQVSQGDALADHVGVAAFVSAPNPLHSPASSSAVKAVGKAAFGKASAAAPSALQAISAKVWNREMMFKLILMSVVSLAPMLIQRWLKTRNSAAEAEGEDVDEAYDDADEEEADDVADTERLLGHSSQHKMHMTTSLDDVNAIELGSTDGYGAPSLRSAAYTSTESEDVDDEDDEMDGAAAAARARSTKAGHARSGSLRHSLVSLGAGRHPRLKRAIAKAFA